MSVELKKMNAIVQKEYGSAPEDVLRISQVAQATIGDDDVLVRVVSASVDRGTWHMMSGLQYPIRLGIGLRRPKALNPGRSFAGEIERVGVNVTDFKPGDEVFGTCDGAFAEFAVAPGSADVVIGASAAISGLFGGILRFGVFRRGFWLLVALWLVMNAVTGIAGIGGAGEPVAWIAHVGGFVAGLLLFSWFDPAPQTPRADDIGAMPQ